MTTSASERTPAISGAATTEIAQWARWRAWMGLVTGLCAGLALLVWAGAGNGPRRALPWSWTATGWLCPAPGFTLLWLGAALSFWLLSALAWMLFTTPPGAIRLRPWASAGIILFVAAALRIAIVRTWSPLGTGFAGRWHMPRTGLIGADIAAVAMLMLLLYRQGRSLWWAALYAWHPLVLIEVAGNGSALAVIPLMLLLLVAAAARWRWVIVPLALSLILGGLWGVNTAAASPFNGWAWELARNFLFRGDEAHTTRAVLILLGVLELGVVVLGYRKHWSLPTTFGHIFVVYLLCTPAMFPAQVLLPLILLPLAWNRAVWVVSVTSLSAYAAVLMQRNGYGFTMPDWLLMAVWMPVAVVEAQALLAEAWGGFRPARLRVSAAPR